MLFNNARCRALTPEYVNSATGLELHQFKWLGGDALIGELPHRWNHLVGYDPPRRTWRSCISRSAGHTSPSTATASTPRAWRAEREAMLYAEERSPRAAAKSASGQPV